MKVIQTRGRGARQAATVIAQLERRGGAALEPMLPAVRRIVSDVHRNGDKALLRYARKLDSLPARDSIRVSAEEMRVAWESATPRFRDALEAAAGRVRAFAVRQMPKSWTFRSGGVTTGQLVRPIGSAGCYIPGGRHPLPSTLLMTVIPAQTAGVERIVVVSPRPARETLAAAHLLGVTEFYRAGGAHAIAALAYGTESIGAVQKIAGPGNLYVTAAKSLVAQDCSIDMLAGPTEIVVTSESGDAAGIAADLVAQAEHDPEALAIFITTGKELARAVRAEVKTRSRTNLVARESLQQNGLIILASTLDEAREITNRIAPEHLTVDSVEDLPWVRDAGSVFVGDWSAQPMGDYISGPNHTLPTGGMARVRGGLSVLDFVKIITVQEYTREGISAIGPHAAVLAEYEGLSAHADAIRLRVDRAAESRRANA
ncbi:MAG TPA: histidinol dehydrogenase [Terracidiphilus sp.]|jgi:histidinol dehydrogenase|nr:histidinol dehydrogenase [Terracidiphilus sp.]